MVGADTVRQPVPVFEIADFVDARDAVLQHRGIAGHAAFEIAAHQRVQIVFEEIVLILFFWRKNTAPELFLPTPDPAGKRQLHELVSKLLHVGESGARMIPDKMR